MVWQNVVLTSADQLRQRMAWALSQTYVLGNTIANYKLYQEIFHQFYDIFVRHAFGSLRSVLQEISRSPMMGRYLTFHKSRSVRGCVSNRTQLPHCHMRLTFDLCVAAVRPFWFFSRREFRARVHAGSHHGKLLHGSCTTRLLKSHKLSL